MIMFNCFLQINTLHMDIVAALITMVQRSLEVTASTTHVTITWTRPVRWLGKILQQVVRVCFELEFIWLRACFRFRVKVIIISTVDVKIKLASRTTKTKTRTTLITQVANERTRWVSWRREKGERVLRVWRMDQWSCRIKALLVKEELTFKTRVDWGAGTRKVAAWTSDWSTFQAKFVVEKKYVWMAKMLVTCYINLFSCTNPL